MRYTYLMGLLIFTALLGQNTPTNIDQLRKKAEAGDPVSQYELGRYIVDAVGVDKEKERLGSAFRRIDEGYAWMHKAALGGLVIEKDYSASEIEAVKDWKTATDEANKLLSQGRIKEASIQAKDAEIVSEEKLKNHTWFRVSTYVLQFEIAKKETNVGEALKILYALSFGAYNAYAELQKIPDSVVIPEYVINNCKLLLEININKDDPKLCLSKIDEVIKVVDSNCGDAGLYSVYFRTIRAEQLAKLDRQKEAEREYLKILSLLDRSLTSKDPQKIDIILTFADIYTKYLHDNKRFKEESEIIEKSLSLYGASGKVDIVYASYKKKLLMARVKMRVEDSDDFGTVEQLPDDEALLRKLADDGNPLACFKLSILIKSGKISSRIPASVVPLIPESKIYTDASICPFIDETKFIAGYFDEKVCKRFARLGHGYAQYELSKYLKDQNKPWPDVPDGSAQQGSEHTSESWDMLKIAAKSGVPDALADLAVHYMDDHYYHSFNVKRSNQWSPYLANDGNWYKKVYNHKNKDKFIIIKRLNNNPIVRDADYAAAAYYALPAYIAGHDSCAFWLALIYASGARGSSDGTFDSNFPAILPDKVESAAWHLVCKYSKDNSWGGNADSYINELSLNKSEYEAANKRAKELMKLRKEG